MIKKSLFPLLLPFFLVIMSDYCEGFDLSGLQPPAPYGVFSTISANTPERGRAAVAFSVEKSGKPDFFRLSSQFAFGVTDNVEVGMNIPYFENSEEGLEDIAFGLKHRFFNEGRHGPSLAYIVTGSVDSGTEGLGTGGRFGGGLAVSKRIGPVYGHANALWCRPFDSDFEDEIRLSAGIDFSAAHNFKILGELFGRKSHFSEEFDQLEARMGYRFTGRDYTLTTLGVGFGIKDRFPGYRLMASVSLLFPRQETAIKRVYEEEGR